MARIAAVAVVICAMTALLAGPGQSLAHANPSTPAAAAAGSAQHVAGDVLVRFEPGSGRQQRAAALAKLDAGRGEPLPVPGLRLVQVGEVGVARAVASWSAGPACSTRSRTTSSSWGMTPDDDYFGSQWALENTGMGIDNPPVFGTPDADIDAAAAWDLSTGQRRYGARDRRYRDLLRPPRPGRQCLRQSGRVGRQGRQRRRRRRQRIRRRLPRLRLLRRRQRPLPSDPPASTTSTARSSPAPPARRATTRSGSRGSARTSR